MRMRVGFLLVFLMSLTVAGRGYQFAEILNPMGETLRLRWGRDSMPIVYYFNRTPPRTFSLDEALEHYYQGEQKKAYLARVDTLLENLDALERFWEACQDEGGVEIMAAVLVARDELKRLHR